LAGSTKPIVAPAGESDEGPMVSAEPLRLLTYLSPGLPLGLYEVVADYLAVRLERDVTASARGGL